MKNISTGTGLCVLGICAVLYPVIDRFVPTAGLAQAAAPTAPVNAAKGPAEPTIVWYGTTGDQGLLCLTRAWSDGRIEGTIGTWHLTSSGCNGASHMVWYSYTCPPDTWRVLSDPNQGYSSSADINFDAKVDGADLGQLLAMWGPAPRHDIPPSDCPLNLINP